MSIRYNVLNLPDTIQFSNGHQITNRYTADGIKHMSTYITSVFDVAIPLGSVCQWYRYSRQVYQSNGTIYCGNAEYEIIPTGGASLQRIGFGNGYIRNNTYYYTITDYLGNISSVWNGTSNVVEQQTTYYPSGLPHRTSTNANLQRYKYNGKELITNHGYDQYDYHARGYYPAIMRFTSVDPLAEADYETGMYVYCGNNPIIRIDPDGRFWNYVAGGVAGAVIEIGTQVVANAVTGADQNINWNKVGVSALEGALTSGGSVALKVGATLGAAVAQSALDGNEGVKDIAKGALVNLGSGAVGSGASKLAKGVGEKGLENVANKMVGSKTAITKSVQNLTNTSTKTAREVAKTVQNAEKAAAKEVRKASQSTTKSATSGVASGVYENNKKKNP